MHIKQSDIKNIFEIFFRQNKFKVLLVLSLLFVYSILIFIVGGIAYKDGVFGKIIKPAIKENIRIPVNYIRSLQSRPENIVIDIKDRVLTLKGERSLDNEVKEDNFYRRERAFGKFERAFTLPTDVDSGKIEADFKDGVLKIDIPKPEKQKPKQITIH